MTGLAGRAPNDLWAVGGGATIVHWNGESWEDQSSLARASMADAGFPIDDIKTVSVGTSFVMFAGSYGASGNEQTSCGWKYADAVGAPFMSLQDCSGQPGFRWLGGTQCVERWALVGEEAHLHLDNLHTLLQDGTGADLPDYRATYLRSDDELWIAGTSGAVRYMRLTDTSSLSAVDVGFPATGSRFDAILALDDALFVGGEGALYECARKGSTMAPSLVDCRNHVSAGQSIRGLVGSSPNDVWAVGVESGAPLLMRRTGTHAWQPIAMPAAAGPLSGAWRGPSLVVVAGEGGLFSTVWH